MGGYFMNIACRFPGGKSKALTLSYDDGRIEDRKMVEIINRYGIKATFHINSGLLDKEGFIRSDEVKDLFDGHEISLHTLNHPFLTNIPTEQIIREVQDDRRNLEALAGYPIKGMSYPFGVYNDKIVDIFKTLGIVYSRTVHSTGTFDLPGDFLRLNPTIHHKQDLLKKTDDFLAINNDRVLHLFYVWGHSFEFEYDNNWGLLEDFCKKVGGKEQVWFATNIEIYRYLKALESLDFSEDTSLVYNPSCLDISLCVGDKIVEVGPGQLVNIF